MKNSRLRRYLEKRKDARTMQDFPGSPGGTPDPDIIKPENPTEKKIAAIDTKDGEKMLNPPSKRRKNDPGRDDGSAGAFEATETVKE